MKEYVTSSLETHLFFGRIMKEHALFLQAGVPAGETAYRSRADRYREEFEKTLWQTVRLADGMADRMGWQIRRLNQRVLQLLNGLIMFKKQILRDVTSCRLYTANYPLLIEHIIREAELYRKIITMLEEGKCSSQENIAETERFWNRILKQEGV